MNDAAEHVPAIRIAAAVERELPLLFTMAATAFGNEPGWDALRVARVLASDWVFVARVGGDAVGYVAVDPDVNGWRIDQLLVAVGHERRGVGKLLLAYTEALAARSDQRALRIVCEESNFRARDLYRRFGFEPIARELWERSLPSR